MSQPYIFAGQATIHDVVHSLEKQARSALAGISSEKLRDRSIEDLTSELVKRFRLEVPVLDRAGIKELQTQEVDMDVSAAPDRAFFESGPHYTRGTSVRISIPFIGDAQLFCYPSSNLDSRIPAEVVGRTVVLAHVAEHPDQSEIQRDFDNRLSVIETALQFVRSAADEWNRRLSDTIRSELEKRTEQRRDRGLTPS